MGVARCRGTAISAGLGSGHLRVTRGSASHTPKAVWRRAPLHFPLPCSPYRRCLTQMMAPASWQALHTSPQPLWHPVPCLLASPQAELLRLHSWARASVRMNASSGRGRRRGRRAGQRRGALRIQCTCAAGRAAKNEEGRVAPLASGASSSREAVAKGGRRSGLALRGGGAGSIQSQR